MRNERLMKRQSFIGHQKKHDNYTKPICSRKCKKEGNEAMISNTYIGKI